MLLLAAACDNAETARTMLLQAIDSGQAMAKFREWICAQGGDAGVVDDVGLMAQARLVEDLLSPQSGYVEAINAMQVGLATVALGAGREEKGEAVDHAVGVVLKKKVGDRTKKGEPLLTIHANDEQRLHRAQEALLDAYQWSDTPVQAPPLILEVIR